MLLTSASASEIASRSAFIASMRATESSESTGADATQDNNGTLRTMELEDEDYVGLIGPLDDIVNHEHTMNQQEFQREYLCAVNIFPKLPVYLRTHYSRWQQIQRVRDAVDRGAPSEARLREINAALGIQSDATTVVAMVPVILSPTILQLSGILL